MLSEIQAQERQPVPTMEPCPTLSPSLSRFQSSTSVFTPVPPLELTVQHLPDLDHTRPSRKRYSTSNGGSWWPKTFFLRCSARIFGAAFSACSHSSLSHFFSSSQAKKYLELKGRQLCLRRRTNQRTLPCKCRSPITLWTSLVALGKQTELFSNGTWLMSP